MSHVSVKKTCFCYNQLPVSFRSCCGSVLLDGSFWPCGLCLLLRVGIVLLASPRLTLRYWAPPPRQGKHHGGEKKCAYLWRRAPPRARPRDVRSWQQEASAVENPDEETLWLRLHTALTLRLFWSHPSWLAVSAVVELTSQAWQRHWNDNHKIVVGAAPLLLLCCFLGRFRCPSGSAAFSLGPLFF